MTIGEFIEYLKKYPEVIEILVTWEGCFRSIDHENIYLHEDTDPINDTKSIVLLIDADDNFYKSQFEKKT